MGWKKLYRRQSCWRFAEVQRYLWSKITKWWTSDHPLEQVLYKEMIPVADKRVLIRFLQQWVIAYNGYDGNIYIMTAKTLPNFDTPRILIPKEDGKPDQKQWYPNIIHKFMGIKQEFLCLFNNCIFIQGTDWVTISSTCTGETSQVDQDQWASSEKSNSRSARTIATKMQPEIVTEGKYYCLYLWFIFWANKFWDDWEHKMYQ